jgi:FKBP-type peptidyl-prolyl cis-trans isomerase
MNTSRLAPLLWTSAALLAWLPGIALAQQGDVERLTAELAAAKAKTEELVLRAQQLEQLLSGALRRVDEATERAEAAEAKLRLAEARVAELEGQAEEAPAGLVEGEGGLRYEDVRVGDGASPRSGQMLTVHYTGWLEDGTKFDSSHDRGEPIQFILGARQVIAGWEQGLAGMQVGGKRRLVIPPALAYGEKGAGRVIPPNATLVFEVELVAVE